MGKVRFQVGEYMLAPLDDARPAAIADFQLRNRDRFQPYSPLRTAAFYTERYWRHARSRMRRERVLGRALRWGLADGTGVVLAQVNMDHIMRGAFQSAALGYSLDESLEGRGIMTECLRRVTGYAFAELDLHRLTANHVPENVRSAAVLARLGFQREGLARSYLRLNGVWRDHVLNALINPRHASLRANVSSSE